MSLLKTGLIGAGIIAIAYAAYNYYKIETDLLQNSDYKITDISIDAITLEKVSLNIGLELNNSSDVNVTIQSLYLDIYVNGSNVGYVMQTIQTPISPKVLAVIPLKTTVSISNAFNSITNNIGGLFKGKASMDIQATGTVGVKSGFVSTTVPISFEKTLSL